MRAPVAPPEPARKESDDRPGWNLMEKEIQREIGRYTDGFVDVQMTSDTKAVVYIDDKDVPAAIGKGGKNVSAIVNKIGIGIDIKPRSEFERQATAAPKAEEEFNLGGGIKITTDKKQLTIVAPEQSGRIVDVFAGKEYLFTATVNENGEIHLAKNSSIAQEMIRRGVLRFEPRGEAVVQVFGIGLLSLGELSFGRPIRVVASAYMGTGGVVNLEREVSLSGPIHTKGFLIISGYLGALFARTQPLVFSGTLSFEQMYEELEGDSASAAELFALVSAISRVPLRQGIGVTGAVNQEGVILPVGGVTDKVEGFFEACRTVGLTGEQGVILPRRNAENLVLRQDVRDAVAQGRFRIWTIDRIEEGWPILSGREAGAELAPGEFPPGSVHHAVMQQLGSWADAWKRLDDRGAPAAQS